MLIQVYKKGSPVMVQSNRVHEYLAMPGWSAEPPSAPKSAKPSKVEAAKAPPEPAEPDLFSTDPPVKEGGP